MAIIGGLFVALYAGIATSTSWVRICQENEVATQILSDKLDVIRLYNWDQLKSNGFILTNFTTAIDPLQTNTTAYYTGRVSIVTDPISEVYRTNLLKITVDIDWSSGNRLQSRSMSTFVTRYGLQSYVMR